MGEYKVIGSISGMDIWVRSKKVWQGRHFRNQLRRMEGDGRIFDLGDIIFSATYKVQGVN